MTILCERISWSRPRRENYRVATLTVDEQAGVRKALRTLRIRYGSTRALAHALGLSVTTVSHVMHAERGRHREAARSAPHDRRTQASLRKR